jgi:Putative amidoligase enzyme
MPMPVRPIPPEGIHPVGGFRPGDVVYSEFDPLGYELECAARDPLPEGYGSEYIWTARWGSQSQSVAEGFRRLNEGTVTAGFTCTPGWRLLARPGPGKRIPSELPCGIVAGMKEADPDWVTLREMAKEANTDAKWLDLLKFFARHHQLTNKAYGRAVPGYAGLDLGLASPGSDEVRVTTLRTFVAALWNNLGGVPLCRYCVADPNANPKRPSMSQDGYHQHHECAHIECYDCGRVDLSPCSVCCSARRNFICAECCRHRTCACGTTGQRGDFHEGCGHFFRGSAGACCECDLCECGQPRDAGGGCRSGNCDQCGSCCSCEDVCMPKTKNPLVYWDAPKGEKGMTRLMGTELEIANADTYAPSLKAAVKKWSCNIVPDGSLGDRGMELVTAPAGGSQFKAMIADITKGFTESKSRVSAKCGQHVHVDARDMGPYELARLIRLYAKLEGSMFSALPVERYNGRYSSLCGFKYMGWLEHKGKLTKAMLAAKQYGLKPPKAGEIEPHGTKKVTAKDASLWLRREVDARKAYKYDHTRYSALNLHSYWHRGTVEFRHGHGVTSFTDIYNWSVVCGTIVDTAVKLSNAQLLSLLEEADPVAIFQKILQPEQFAFLKERWAFYAAKHAVRRSQNF